MTGSNTGNNYKIQCTYNSVMEGMGREKGYGLDAKEADISAISKYCKDDTWPDNTSKFSKNAKVAACSCVQNRDQENIDWNLNRVKNITDRVYRIWKNHGFKETDPQWQNKQTGPDAIARQLIRDVKNAGDGPIPAPPAPPVNSNNNVCKAYASLPSNEEPKTLYKISIKDHISNIDYLNDITLSNLLTMTSGYIPIDNYLYATTYELANASHSSGPGSFFYQNPLQNNNDFRLF